MVCKNTNDFFRRHTDTWTKPAPPLEVQFELFPKKDHSLRIARPGDEDSESDRPGDLAVLPLDVLHMILWHADLQTVTNFRCINRYCLSVVESVTAFKIIERHALKAYRAILMIQSAPFITLGQFTTTIQTARCCIEGCTNFAPYIYLITCIRVCETCIKSSILLFPLPLYHATCLFGLGTRALQDVPHMLPWQGIEKATGQRVRTKVMVDYGAALAAGLARHGSQEAMKKHGSNIFPELDSASPPSLQRSDIWYTSVTHEWDASNSSDLRRWLAICSAPCVSQLEEVPVKRRCCRTCNDNLLYSREEFAAHVDEIDAAECQSSTSPALNQEDVQN